MLDDTRKTMVLKLALKRVKELKATAQEYLAEVDAWYQYGDGRSSRIGGKGYAFPHCFHGSSRWTDYDNICPGCEDGYSPYRIDWMYKVALADAKYSVGEFERRMNWLDSSPTGLPQQLVRPLIDWVVEAIR